MLRLPTSEGISVLIVDDEQPARQRLRDLVHKDPQIEKVFEADNGMAAVCMIQEHRPNLVFLDVQMPELDGLGVVEGVGATEMPMTIFVTAFDQHAIRAFEANALDYLLKPFSDERFEAALARAKTRLKEHSLGAIGRRLLDVFSTLPPEIRRWDRLVVKSGGTTRFLRVVEIDWIEAAGIYVNLHVGGKELLYRASLNELISKLDPLRFIRIHRSVIINIESVTQLEPVSHGEFEVVLRDGARARVSRTYRTQLEKRLGQPL